MRPLLAPLTLIPASCVVTSTPVFQEQLDCPPSFIIQEAEPPYNKVKIVNAGTSEFRDVAVTLRSCALTQEYETRTFLDGRVVDFRTFPATGESLRLERFPVPDLTGTAPGCHSLELLASSRFLSTTDQRTPAKQGDLTAIAWFFVLKAPGDTTVYSAENCNK
ncbi:MAG: hypothetical protein ABI175_03215 [Polyangiales bacterium]